MTNSIKSFIKYFIPKYQKLILEYKVDMKPRFGYGLGPHPLLKEIINRNRAEYEHLLNKIVDHKEVFRNIKSSELEKNEDEIAWNNGYLPAMDIFSLYTIIDHFKPRKYIEIGSGNSTKVARKCVKENKLNTKIISIDPFPRANIDHLADEVIREPLENIDDYQFIINDLNENDILFIDNSHRCLPNSDATVFFLELLPFLKKGVVVHIHDIYLPNDYPQFMCDRFYSEQYVLAAFILANPEKYYTIFPGIFITEDKDLSAILSPIWDELSVKTLEKHGGSYWLQIK